ncbi:hypothetical protein ACWEOA_31985 [Streptomyces sp. NPDC004457]
MRRVRGAGGVTRPAFPAAEQPVPPPAASPAPVAVPPGAPRVTLVTGDTVTVVRAPDGTLSHLVQDPEGRYTGFETHRSGRNTYVYPRDALPYVAAGLLDRELFDVTRLLADGYDDAHRDRLPLIVTYTDADPGRRTPPRGARTTRALDSIGGAALAVDRSAAFWTSVTGGASARDAGRRPRLQGGVAKIRLDGKVGPLSPTAPRRWGPRGCGPPATPVRAWTSRSSTPAWTPDTPTSPAGSPPPRASCPASP